jgi:hypothetical protein
MVNKLENHGRSTESEMEKALVKGANPPTASPEYKTQDVLCPHSTFISGGSQLALTSTNPT